MVNKTSEINAVWRIYEPFAKIKNGIGKYLEKRGYGC
jgi:hypothetical protein